MRLAKQFILHLLICIPNLVFKNRKENREIQDLLSMIQKEMGITGMTTLEPILMRMKT